MLYWKRRDSKIPLDEVADSNSNNSDIEVQIDQTYAPTSPNAQSGTAVAQAVSQLESSITSKYGDALRYKGSVASESALPKNGQNQKGDVYNVQDTGANYAWDGNQWDKLNENLDGYVKQETFNSLQSSFNTHKQNNDPDLHHLTEEEFAKVGSIEIFSQEAIKEAIDSKIKEQISTGGIITSSDLESKLLELQTQVQQTVTQNVTETLSTDFVNSADFESYKTQHENDLDNFLVCEQADELMVYTKNGEAAPPLNERKSRVLYLIGKESTIGSDPVIPVPPTDKEDESEGGGAIELHFTTTSIDQEVDLGYCLAGGIPQNENVTGGTIDWGDNSDNVTFINGDNKTDSKFKHSYSNTGEHIITITGKIFWGDNGLIAQRPTNDIRKLLTKIIIPTGKKSSIYDIAAFGFSFCTNLTMIPSGLLDNCTQTTSFYGCFGGSPIVSIPEGLFDKCVKAKSFTETFTQCNYIESKLPELWKNPELSDGSCFEGCTNASNYDQVPAGWGGPTENV